MKKQILSVVLGSLVSSMAAAAHWGYEGAEGPSHWAELSSEFDTCATGKNQSPINLTHMVKGDLPALKINYAKGGQQIVNNGHTVQVNYTPGSTLEVDGHTYELKQFHFHTPSENNIEGESFPMEAHFVHADKDGNLAVVAVMFKIGDFNPELEKAWSQMPAMAGDQQQLKHVVSAANLLPKDHNYMRFSGSLTTPPCTEGVSWFVMKGYDTASKEQIEHFAHTMHHNNNRPLQAMNARVVVQ